MTHWTDGPIAGFDTETTGTDVEKDRIVTYCVERHEPGYSRRPVAGLVNPGIMIPEAASKVHGVTNEMAESGEKPTSALVSIVSALYGAWDRGVPVVVYNAVFDLTVLDRECRRHLGPPHLEIRGPVIDPLVLDKAVDTYRRGSRRLADVCAHYGVTLTEEDAHSAEGDVRAAMRLAWKIARSGLLPSEFDGNLSALHEFQAEAYRKQRLSFNAYLQKQGKQPDDDNLVWPMKPYNGEVKPG